MAKKTFSLDDMIASHEKQTHGNKGKTKAPTASKGDTGTSSGNGDGENWQPNEFDLMGIGKTIEAVNNTLGDTQRTINRIDNDMTKVTNPLDVGTVEIGKNRKVRKKEISVLDSLIDSHKKQTYINESGAEYDNETMAMLDQQAIDKERAYKLDPIGTELKDALAERDEIVKRLNERDKELNGDNNNGLAIGMNAHPYWDYTIGDKEYGNLSTALRKNHERILALKAHRDKAGDQFWRNFGDTFKKSGTWTFGISDALDALRLATAGDAKNARENNAEQTMFEQTSKNNIAQAEYDKTRNWVGNGGIITANMIPFALEVASGAGAFTKLGKAGAKLATKIAGNAVKGNAGQWTVKTLGKLGGYYAGSAIVANTTGLGGTLANIGERYSGEIDLKKDENGDYVRDDNGKLVYEQKKGNLAKSIYQGEVSSIREFFTEKALEPLLLGKGLTKGMEKIGLSKITDGLKTFGNVPFVKTMRSWMKRSGLSNYPEEAMEEELGIIIGSLDGTGDNKISDLWDKDQQLDIWGGMAFSMGALGAVQLGAGARGYVKYNKQVKNADKEASIFIKGWDDIRQTIDAADNDNIAGVVKGYLESDELPLQSKRALMNYSSALMQFRGFNNASEGVKEDEIDEGEGKKASTNTAMDFAYLQGYASDEDTMKDIRARYETTRQKLSEMLGGDVDIDNDIISGRSAFDVIEDMETRTDDDGKATFSEDERVSVLDYLKAKTAYDGMMDGVRDNINEAVKEAQGTIKSQTNINDGLFYTGKTKSDKAINIISGHIERTEDGKINLDLSDDTVVVRFSDTGEPKMIDTSNIVEIEEPISASQLEDEVKDNITQQMNARYSSLINGELTPEVGKWYDMADINGEVTHVTILDQNQDGNYIIQYEGQENAFIATPEQLQQAYDVANARRLQDSLAERQRSIEESKAAQARAAETPENVVEPEESQENIEDNATTYSYGDIVAINLRGEQVNGTVAAVSDDGRVELLVTDPTTGNENVVSYTTQELNAMNTGSQVVDDETTTTPVEEEQPVEQETTEPETALSRIPTQLDENGQPVVTKKGKPVLLWEEAPIEDTVAALSEINGGVLYDIRDTASAMREKAETALTKAKQKKATGDDPIEIAESKMENRKAVEAAQAKVDYWKNVARNVQSKMSAAERQAEAEAEARLTPEERAAREKKRVEEAAARQEANRIELETTLEEKRRQQEQRAKYAPMLKAKREFEHDEDAMQILSDTEPHSLEEYVASSIPMYKFLWNDSGEGEGKATGLQTETGYSNKDMQRLLNIIGTKEKGGKPFNWICNRIYEDMPEGMKNMYDDTDVKNTLLDILQSSESTKDLWHYIQDRRIEEARQLVNQKEEQTAEAELETYINDMGMTPDEAESYAEMMRQPIESVPAEALAAINEMIENQDEEIQEYLDFLNNKNLYDDYEQSGTSEEMGGEPVEGRVSGSTEESQEGMQNPEGTSEENNGIQGAEGNETLSDSRTVTDDAVAEGASAGRTDERGTINKQDKATSLQEPARIQRTKHVKTSLTEDEAYTLLSNMEDSADISTEKTLTADTWNETFDENNSIETPMGRVKMGDNQIAKFFNKNRVSEFGMVGPTLRNPDIIIEVESKSKTGESERTSSFLFIKTFNRNGEKIKYYTSITVKKDGLEVSVSSHYVNKNKVTRTMQEGKILYIREALLPNSSEWRLAEHQINDVPDLLPTQGSNAFEESHLLQKGEMVWKHADDVSTASDVADGLYSSRGNVSDPTTEGTDAPQTTISGGKDTNNSLNGNEFEQKSAIKNKKNAETEQFGGVNDAIAAAEADVNTNPTEGQKEAGNYKKGHVQVGVFDITIEQPKGSVRRGKDANGKAWETEMKNTYGYIRGTEGVDGDHIDIFLSDDVDGWNGGKVFVVDQYNEDGTFDEHKVMLGFNDKDEAESAYFANYDKDWGKKRRIDVTPVTLEDFEKWIDSSHRKTKAFTEYASVRKANNSNTEVKGYSVTSSQYTTKRGKTLDMLLVKFDKPLNKEQHRALSSLAKEKKGWWDKSKGGFMMRNEEDAMSLVNAISEENGEQLADAAPLSLADIKEVNKVDMEGLFNSLKTNGEAKLSDHAKPVASEQTASKENKASKSTNSGQFGLVSDARMEELRERLRKKMLGQMNMGIDPEILTIGIELTAGHIDRGIKKFADYAKAMIDDLGDAIRPYLKSFYNGARDLPEVIDSGLADEMTSYDEVRNFDVANFDKTTKDAIATAEQVVAEQEAQKQAEEGEKKLKEQRNVQRRAIESLNLRPATQEDLENASTVYYNGRRYGILMLKHQGSQVSATQFSEPKLYGVVLSNLQEVKPEELYVEDKTADAESKPETKSEKNTAKKAKSQKKAVSLQQEADLFGSLDNDNINNSNDYGLQRNDAVRSEGLSADNSGQQEGRRENSGAESQGARQGSERPDRRGEGSGAERTRNVRPGLHGSIDNPHNTNNNHAERGTDYAPKSVDGRIQANIKAIELMQQLIESGEKATPEQMTVLRQYSGWGGLGKAFNEDNPTSKQLRTLLGDEAYKQANMSRNSAYYTPANVIDTLWDIAEAMGFNGGKVLEGSAGIGNILGLMPVNMSGRSDIHAVEIDNTSGNILSLLYPDAKVDIKGFEATQVENGSVDLAITNVPFVTGLRVNDTTGDKDLSKKFKDIHDFCIAKNIRKLRAGGIGIFITSSGTLDNSAKLREWIIGEGSADVVGAFRLNNETFGGTGATSDIIVVRKRVNGRPSPHAIDVLNTTGERVAEYDTGDVRKIKGTIMPVVKQLAMDYNQYFVEHPENMGGEMRFGFEEGDTFRPTSKALYPVAGKNQTDLLSEWADSFADKKWETASTEQTTETDGMYKSLGDDVKEGSMVIDDNGRLCIAQRGKAVPLSVNTNKVKGHTKEECFKSYKDIKDTLSDVLEYQTTNDDNAGLQPLLDKLNKTFDRFVNTYGHLHKNTSISFLKNDVDYANVLALEKYSEHADANGKMIEEYGKTDIFERRVVEKEKMPEPKNVKDGIIASLYMYGKIDVPYISGQLDMSESDVKDDIIKSGLGFENPTSRQMEVSYEYLSGNVREKLQQAIDNNHDGKYNANIKALEKVVPMNIPAHLIDFSLGSSWIDPKLYEEYVKEKTAISVTFTAAGGTWFMDEPYYVGTQENRIMGVKSNLFNRLIMGTQLIEAAMQNKTITVSETKKKYDGSTETVTDKEATQACANKIDEIRQDFKEWARNKMKSNPAMSEHIEMVYNDMFNNYVPKSIPDEFVPTHFGGQVTEMDGKPFSLRPHQAKAVVRGTTQPLLLAHEVGTGKTYTLISTAMEMRRLGTARKPMIVVQNATVGQFLESAKELYPGSKVLTLDDKDHTSEGRKDFYAKIKYNDWDMIVVPQSVFERIPDSDERQMKFVQDKIAEKMLVLEQMQDADPSGRSMIVRQAQKEIDNLKTELASLTDNISTKRKARDEKKAAVSRQNAEVKALEMLDREVDDVENFDDMGIDAILVDEAHEYKHLGFATAMQRGVKGVDPSYSKKAQGVYLKTQAVLEKNHGRNVIFATGTPISNTAAEIWTFMRYLMPADTMKDYGIYYFDDFVRNFGNLTQMLEFTTNGKFKENNRFAGYVNLPELVRIWSSVADTVLTREAGGVKDKIPALEGDKAQDIYLPQTRSLRSVMKYVKQQLEKYENMSGKEKKENSHIPLTMYGIAKAAAVDARLVVDDAIDEEQSKTNEAVRQTLRSLKETASYKGTVALFADNYQNKRSGFNLYEDIRKKLIDAGVPADQIVVMKSGMSVKKKLDTFDRVNRGDVRVIMGSTFTLGTGVNIQERLHTLIHLDAPNRPMDYTQRNGRILRQGNIHKDMDKPVRVLRFGVEDSLDVTAYQRLKTKGAIADSIMNGKQMMQNSMENRALEEEEDVFGDTVAQLSGSEYAMLKNQAEKDVRKYQSKKKQWEDDQTYCHNEIPRLESEIKELQNRLNQSRKALATVEALPADKTITIGKQTFANIEAMADYFKDYNKKIREVENDLRDNPSIEKQERSLTVNVGGMDFNFNTVLNIETKEEQGTLFSAVRRKMTFSCDALGLEDAPVRQSLLREGIEDIVTNIVSGNDFREDIERYENNIAKTESTLAQVRERDGKPFEFEKELQQSKERLEEYTDLMKKELEEKEAKYAAMDSEVSDINDVAEAQEDDDEDNVLLREGDSSGEIDYDDYLRSARRAGYSKKQVDAMFERQWRRMRLRAEDAISKLGLNGRVTILENADGLKGRKARAKGWYDGKTGKIVIVMSNHSGPADVVKTIMHEGVAHYGLRALFGENFNQFLDNVYQNAGTEVRTKIFNLAKKHDWDLRVATEEYLASLAENTDFERATQQGWWRAIKNMFFDMVRRIGLSGYFSDYVTDNELRYILWRSYKNLEEPGRYTNVFRQAEDISKRMDLGIASYDKEQMRVQRMGRFDSSDRVAERAVFAEPSNPLRFRDSALEERFAMYDVNEAFNEALKSLNEENADSVTLSLGRPSMILRSAGIEDKPMKLYGSKVIKKMKKHGFTLAELPNLPLAVASPIAVFNNYEKEGNRSVLTELRTANGNFLVAIDLGKGDNDIDFNVISSVFGKDNNKIVKWINKGFATYINKEKALNYLHHSAPIAEALSSPRLDSVDNSKPLSHQSAPIAATAAGEELNSAAKIVENFENPNISDEKFNKEAENSYRIADNYRIGRQEKMKAAAEEMASSWNNLGVKVDIVDSKEGLSGRRANAKGWFNASTNTVTVVLPNHHGVWDVQKTVMHEVIGHYGLRNLVGAENMDTFLDDVYANADKEMKARIDELSEKYDGNKRVATEEYMAQVAENTDFNDGKYNGLWRRVKNGIIRLLNKIGVNVSPLSLTAADVKYMLWRSWRKLTQEGNEMNTLEAAEDIAMQSSLGVGNYTPESSVSYSPSAERNGTKEYYRMVSDVEKDKAKDAYEQAVSTYKFKSQMAWQDSMLGLKKLQDAIAKGTGSKVEDWQDAYLAENRMSSKNYAEMEAYRETFFKDLINAVKTLTGKNKASYQQLVDYMTAKHALERNIVLAFRDAIAEDYETPKEQVDAMDAYNNLPDHLNNVRDMREGKITYAEYLQKEEELRRAFTPSYEEKRANDYAGLTALTKDIVTPSEFTNPDGTTESIVFTSDMEAAAWNMVDEFEAGREAECDELWRATNAATKASLAKLYESGLMDNKKYEGTRDMFEYYVPLRGFSETTSDEVYNYLTGWNGFGAKVLKEAKGRKSKADDPIATIGNMAERSIMEGNRNLMKQHFLKLVMDHPTDAVSISEVILHKPIGSDNWEMAPMPDLSAADTREKIAKIMEKYNFDAEWKLQSEPDNYKRARENPDIPYKVIGKNLNEHQVNVKMLGKDYILTINGNPVASQALNGLTNPDSDKNLLFKTLSVIKRFLSMVFTQKNPNFIFDNLSRDAIYANSMVMVKEKKAYSTIYRKNHKKALLHLGKLIQRQMSGTLDMNNPLDKMFHDFVMNGGETGYTFLRSVDAYKDYIANALSKSQESNWNPRKWARLLNDMVEFIGRWAEDTSRFAAYMTSREVGRSIERSIYDAKEITVNFNKKGSGSKYVKYEEKGHFWQNASLEAAQYGRDLYVFFNAGVQGMCNFAKGAIRNPKAFIKMLGIFMSAGALWPIVQNAIVAAVGGDDDDDYYNLPEYVRRSHLCFYVGGHRWLLLSLPIEMRAFYGIGEILSGQCMGKTNYTLQESSWKVFEQLSQLLPLDIAEGGGSLMAFVPSAIKPFAEAYITKKDWTGMPIYKDNDFNKDMPEWTKAYNGTNKQLVQFAAMLNGLTGGDKYTKGWADLNPATIEHLAESYLGGIGKFVNQSYKTLSMAWDEDMREMRNVPIISGNIRQADDRTRGRAISEKYYRYLDSYRDTERKLRGYKKEERMGNLEYAEKLDFLLYSKEYENYEMLKGYKDTIDKLRREKAETTDKEEQRMLDEAIRALMAEAVDVLESDNKNNK